MFLMLALDIFLKIISLPVVGPAVAVIIAVYIADWLGKRQRLYEVRSGVLRELVGRRANSDDSGFLIALNSIPVVFHDKEDIKTAWKEYHDIINYTELSPYSMEELKKQLESGDLVELPEDLALEKLANKKFITLVLAICKSLSIKTKENDVLLVFE